MSLLKSKFFLGVLVVVGLAVAGSASAAYMHTGTLKMGMTSSQVMELQKTLNMTSCKVAASGTGSMGMESSYFGGLTKAAVMCFQTANGLTADGVVGPMSGAKLAMVTGSTTSTPGCPAGAMYNSMTGAPCTTSTTLPAGCTSTSGYSTTTGVACNSNPSTPGSNGPLMGGEGSFDYTSTSSNVEDTVKEGDTEKILAFKAEANDSDMMLESVKLEFQNDDYATTSEKMTDYIDTVSVWMGSTKVGEADASDFSRDSGSPDVFTKTISLDGAIVKEDVKATFYIAVEANNNIDSTDMASANWKATVVSARDTDGSGLTVSSDLGDNNNFMFEDGNADDDISIKSSSANPVASTFQVEENSNSDEFLVGAFKLDVDDNSNDVMVTFLNNITLTVDDSANTAASDDAEDIISDVMVKIDGTEYTADLESDTITNGDGDAVYSVDLEDADFTIDSGDSVEVKIYVTFNDQSGNYGVGTSVVASVDGADIDAETDADEVSVSGSFTGKTHTLSVNAPVFELVSKSLALYQAIDGVAAGEEDIFLGKFVFNVTAGDEDVYLSRGVPGDEATYNTVADEVQYTQLGGGAVDSTVIEADDDSLDDGLTSSFLITAGSTEKFTLSIFVRGNDEAEKFTVTSFAYGTADDAAAQYDYDSTVTTGLTSFSTNTVFLAK